MSMVARDHGKIMEHSAEYEPWGNERAMPMGHATGDKLVYCHEAIHLRNKLQKAGYKQKIEKWDSDEESDEDSEDEADLAV